MTVLHLLNVCAIKLTNFQPGYDIIQIFDRADILLISYGLFLVDESLSVYFVSCKFQSELVSTSNDSSDVYSLSSQLGPLYEM